MEPFSSRTRAITCYLLEECDEGLLDARDVLQAVLNWLPEATVREFAEDEGYLDDSDEAEVEEEEEDAEEEETPEAVEDEDVDS
jgi:hypothetical protein